MFMHKKIIGPLVVIVLFLGVSTWAASSDLLSGSLRNTQVLRKTQVLHKSAPLPLALTPKNTTDTASPESTSISTKAPSSLDIAQPPVSSPVPAILAPELLAPLLVRFDAIDAALKATTDAQQKQYELLQAIFKKTIENSNISFSFPNPVSAPVPTPAPVPAPAPAPAPTANVVPGLLAYYNFDNGDFKDASGNAIDATTSSGAPAFKDNVGIGAKALHLDGSSALKLDISSKVPTVTTGQNVTASFWIYNDANSFSIPFSFMKYNVGFDTRANIDDIYKGILFNTQNNDGWGSAYAPLNAQWLYVTAVFANEKMKSGKIYINGVPISLSDFQLGLKASAAADENAVITPQTVFIGARGRDSAYKFKGYIDELKIFDGTLTDDQILSEYNASKTLVKNP